MSRGPAKFTEADVKRALKGAAAAGLPVQRYEIDRDGKIVVIAGAAQAEPELTGARNEWDES